MLGYKARIFKVHTGVSIEDLVPQDNFYRHVEAVLDLSFVRDLVRVGKAARTRWVGCGLCPGALFFIQLSCNSSTQGRLFQRPHSVGCYGLGKGHSLP
jgi:hypothetical protein